MKFKRIMSTALAGVMALSMSATALAASTSADPLKPSFDITGETQAPTISITVPTSGTVIVNPYKMEVLPSGGSEGDEVTDQIISATQWVENKSDVAIKASVTVSGKVEGTAKLNATTTIPDPSNPKAKALTTNSVYLVFESAVTDDASTPVVWSGDGATVTDAKQIVVAAKGTATDLGTLAKGTGTAAGGTAGCLAFHLTGDAVDTPTVAWTNNDKVSVNVAFTFTPTV